MDLPMMEEHLIMMIGARPTVPGITGSMAILLFGIQCWRSRSKYLLWVYVWIRKLCYVSLKSEMIWNGRIFFSTSYCSMKKCRLVSEVGSANQEFACLCFENNISGKCRSVSGRKKPGQRQKQKEFACFDSSTNLYKVEVNLAG